HASYPKSYGETFADVFEYFEQSGKSEIEWGYGKTDRYRVTYVRSEEHIDITLQSIRYDGDWNPILTPVYKVEEGASESEHSMYEVAVGQVPQDAVNIPELVLRSILHGVQGSVRLRQRNGLK
ncbi:hypothetical protein KBD20_03580, partial [Candidatus Saccharibacteria bacterium]|nr:hypothetical protein [Candidatus Saccharibacteria bacterium]